MRYHERQVFQWLLAQAPKGDRIEFGVFKGGTLALISRHGGRTYGVDSFEGMAASTERDMKDGWDPYPKGRLKTPIAHARRAAPKAILIKGFVPDVLDSIDAARFGFVHLDMDQFDPTYAALKWVWPRMVKGGIVCCDDWFAERDWLAAGAINRFAAETGLAPQSHGRKCWWIV